MYGDFNETYRIIIANTETEMHIFKRAHIFSGYKPYFVRPGHICLSTGCMVELEHYCSCEGLLQWNLS